jgi:hypothetical protein
MSYYFPGGCVPTEPYPCTPCPVKELGKVSSVFFTNGYTFNDIEDPAEWTTAICDENVFIVPLTSGTLTPNPKENKAGGRVDTEVDAYEYTLEIVDYNTVTAVIPWWNQVKNQRQMVGGFCTQTLGWIANAPATIVPKQTVADDMTQPVWIGVTIKWIQQDLLVPFVQPTGIFTQCIACS